MWWQISMNLFWCKTKFEVHALFFQNIPFPWIFEDPVHLIKSYYSNSKFKIANKTNHLANHLNNQFSKEDIQIPSSSMKNCSTSLIVKGMQIKTTMRFYLTPERMTVIKLGEVWQWVPKHSQETVPSSGALQYDGMTIVHDNTLNSV